MRIRQFEYFGNSIPKTTFSFEDAMIPLNASIHDVIIDISTNQLSENHRHLMAILSFERLYLYNFAPTIGVP